MALRQQPRGLQEAAVILHRVEAREEPDDDGVLRDPQRRPRLPPRGLRRPEDLAVEAVGNHLPPRRGISQRLVLRGAGLAVVDDRRGAMRQPCAETDEGGGGPALGGEIVERLTDVPEDRRAPARSQPREIRHKVAVIHPALNEIRIEAADEAQIGDSRQRVWRRAAEAETEHGNAESGDPWTDRRLPAERDDGQLHCRRCRRREQLQQHHLRASGAEAGDHMQDAHDRYPASVMKGAPSSLLTERPVSRRYRSSCRRCPSAAASARKACSGSGPPPPGGVSLRSAG